MRWEEMLVDLFDDLEQQAEGLALAERDTEVAELGRAEYAQVDLAARLHASVGHRVVLVVAGLGQVEGTLARVGTDWLLAEGRATVVLHRTDGELVRGQLRRVGADFVELWVSEHAESWRSDTAGHVEVVPFGALAAVRRT